MVERRYTGARDSLHLLIVCAVHRLNRPANEPEAFPSRVCPPRRTTAALPAQLGDPSVSDLKLGEWTIGTKLPRTQLQEDESKFMQDLAKSFNMAGTEEVFFAMLNKAITERPTPFFHYLEIGIASGNTLTAVANHVRKANYTWRCTGIDLCNSNYFNIVNYLHGALSHDIFLHYEGSRRQPFIQDVCGNDVEIVLLKSPDVRALTSPNSINFALIDGCHGKDCVTADFHSIEQSICPHGIVAFHDAMPEDQRQGHQPHCNLPITVREALYGLNLIDSLEQQLWSYETKRPGWKCVGAVAGDKLNSGNGFVFFQKGEQKQNAYQEGFTG